jgi:hypothetical protein
MQEHINRHARALLTFVTASFDKDDGTHLINVAFVSNGW